jgi:hypothetical protein
MTEDRNKRTTTDQVFCSRNSSMPIPECLCELHANRKYADSRNTQQISRLNTTVKRSDRLHAVSHMYVILVLAVKSLTVHKGLTDTHPLEFPVQTILNKSVTLSINLASHVYFWFSFVLRTQGFATEMT